MLIVGVNGQPVDEQVAKSPSAYCVSHHVSSWPPYFCGIHKRAYLLTKYVGNTATNVQFKIPVYCCIQKVFDSGKKVRLCYVIHCPDNKFKIYHEPIECHYFP